MNKTDLISAIAQTAGLTKTDATKALDAIVDTITQSLKQGDEVAILGFGSFSVSERSARQGHNPATGATITIAASKQPKFSAGKKLKDALN